MRGTDEAELEVVKSKVGEMIKSFGAEPFDPWDAVVSSLVHEQFV